MRREEDLGSWLDQVEGGRPASVFTDDVDDTSFALEALLTSEQEPTRVVTLRWERVPALSNELGLLVNALAEATLGLYPELYGTTYASSERWPEAELETAVHEIRRRVPQVLGTACRQILEACRLAQAPIVRKLSNTEQVHQLALAIEPHRLVILIVVRDAAVHSVGLRALAQGAEWLATNTRARVVLILPRPLHNASELDHVTYTACIFTPVPPPPGCDDGSARVLQIESKQPKPQRSSPLEPRSTPPANVSVSPSIGKPHPRSEVERVLFERICTDQQLSPLFSYNIHVPTRYGSSPRVDLLCSQHKLVIEIDGDEHRGIFTWTNDRKRDVELLLSGYRVMRFASSTLVENTEQVLSRIRDAVDLLEGKPFDDKEIRQ